MPRLTPLADFCSQKATYEHTRRDLQTPPTRPRGLPRCPAPMTDGAPFRFPGGLPARCSKDRADPWLFRAFGQPPACDWIADETLPQPSVPGHPSSLRHYPPSGAARPADPFPRVGFTRLVGDRSGSPRAAPGTVPRRTAPLAAPEVPSTTKRPPRRPGLPLPPPRGWLEPHLTPLSTLRCDVP